MDIKLEMEKLNNYFEARRGRLLKVDDTGVKLDMVAEDYRDKSIKLAFSYKSRGLLTTIEMENDHFIIGTSYGNITDIHPKVNASKDDLSEKIVNQVRTFIKDSDEDLKEPMNINLESFYWEE